MVNLQEEKDLENNVSISAEDMRSLHLFSVMIQKIWCEVYMQEGFLQFTMVKII